MTNQPTKAKASATHTADKPKERASRHQEKPAQKRQKAAQKNNIQPSEGKITKAANKRQENQSPQSQTQPKTTAQSVPSPIKPPQVVELERQKESARRN